MAALTQGSFLHVFAQEERFKNALSSSAKENIPFSKKIDEQQMIRQ